jgi:hypothetical protein
MLRGMRVSAGHQSEGSAARMRNACQSIGSGSQRNTDKSMDDLIRESGTLRPAASG